MKGASINIKILTILILCGFTGAAQTVFRGTVIDQATNQPIENARVGVVNQGVGVITNKEGNFTYRKYEEVLDSDSKLKVSAVGYKTLVNDVSVIREMMNKRGVIYLTSEILETETIENNQSEIAVFWDASKKPHRNGLNEIKYLKTYLQENNITEIHFTIFNEVIILEENITISTTTINQLEEKLMVVNYNGIADFDLIKPKEGIQVLLFSNNPPTLGTPYIDQEITWTIVSGNPSIESATYFENITNFTSGTFVSLWEDTRFNGNNMDTDTSFPKREISGRVLGSTGPIHYAKITKQGSLKEYTTNEKGIFKLPVFEGDEVTIYCLGYYPKRIITSNEDFYEINLLPKTEILEEVILIKKVLQFKLFDTIKNRDYTEDGRRVPVRTMHKKYFRKNAFNLAQLIDGWAGIQSRINPRTGYYQTSVRGGCVGIFVDGFASSIEAINIETIVNISVYDGFGSVLPCPARIMITTIYNKEYRDKKLYENGVNPITGNIYDEQVPTLNFNTVNENYFSKSFKSQSVSKKLKSYKLLKTQYMGQVEFYVDMALYFQNIDAGAASIVRSDFAQVAEGNVKGLRILAYLNEHAGEYLKAEKIYKRIVVLAPSQPQSYRDLALIYQETGEYQKSLELYINMMGNQIKGVDFSSLEIPVSNELQRLINKNKHRIDFTRLPNDWLATKFNIDVRMTLDWIDSETPFEFQFVNPDNRFYNWQSMNDKQSKKTQIQEFIIDDAASGKWLVNVRYTGFENEIQIPPYLKYTIYKDYGTINEERTVKLVRLDKQLDKVTLDSFVY